MNVSATQVAENSHWHVCNAQGDSFPWLPIFISVQLKLHWSSMTQLCVWLASQSLRREFATDICIPCCSCCPFLQRNYIWGCLCCSSHKLLYETDSFSFSAVSWWESIHMSILSKFRSFGYEEALTRCDDSLAWRWSCHLCLLHKLSKYWILENLPRLARLLWDLRIESILLQDLHFFQR